MNLDEAINKRRSYRALKPVEINKDTIDILAKTAGLAPSCYNKQPWRFVFVTDKTQLEKIFNQLSKGNEWAKKSSMIIALCADEEDGCVIQDGRKTRWLDTGMATGFMLLKATELGLVMHPIAGFSQSGIKGVLNIPEQTQVMSLIAVGKHDETYQGLTQKQKETEESRPERKPAQEFAFIDEYGKR